MPWCPNCKNEYREGFTICKECGVPLVDELPEEDELSEVIVLDSKVLAERFISYLDYEIGEGAKIKELPEHTFQILIEEKRLKKAKRCFEAFYIVEAQEFARQEAKKAAEVGGDEAFEGKEAVGKSQLEDAEEPDEEDAEDVDSLNYDDSAGELLKAQEASEPEPASSTYVKKSEQEKDLRSTAVTFFVIGAAGIVFLVFNLLGYFPMFDSVISNIVFAVMFIGCILVGFNSLKRAKKAASEVAQEEALTERINSWIQENITLALLMEQRSDSLSKEANFLKELEYLKARITDEFGTLDETYLDYVAEEYYNSHFDNE